MNYFCKTILAMILILSIAGCKTAPPTYTYTSPSLSDPVITFESSFDLYTYFSVNIKSPENNNCSDYDTIGYILKQDKSFLHDKPNSEITIKAPADKKIAIAAIYSFSGGNYTEKCGPLYIMFTPASFEKYVVHMGLITKKICALGVSGKDKNGEKMNVHHEKISQCNGFPWGAFGNPLKGRSILSK
jgi:hypothetical protein